MGFLVECIIPDQPGAGDPRRMVPKLGLVAFKKSARYDGRRVVDLAKLEHQQFLINSSPPGLFVVPTDLVDQETRVRLLALIDERLKAYGLIEAEASLPTAPADGEALITPVVPPEPVAPPEPAEPRPRGPGDVTGQVPEDEAPPKDKEEGDPLEGMSEVGAPEEVLHALSEEADVAPVEGEQSAVQVADGAVASEAVPKPKAPRKAPAKRKPPAKRKVNTQRKKKATKE